MSNVADAPIFANGFMTGNNFNSHSRKANQGQTKEGKRKRPASPAGRGLSNQIEVWQFTWLKP